MYKHFMWPLIAYAHKIAVYNNNYYKNGDVIWYCFSLQSRTTLDLIVPLYSIYAALSVINDTVFMEYLIMKYQENNLKACKIKKIKK